MDEFEKRQDQSGESEQSELNTSGFEDTSFETQHLSEEHTEDAPGMEQQAMPQGAAQDIPPVEDPHQQEQFSYRQPEYGTPPPMFSQQGISHPQNNYFPDIRRKRL